MKYDLTRKTTRGAQRTLDAFMKAMFALLSTMPFEKVSVTELCDSSGYPRSTFYNYFDDKYDLLDYCWQRSFADLHFEEYPDLDPDEVLDVLFDRAYDYLTANLGLVRRVLRANAEDAFLMHHFQRYLGARVRETFEHCQATDRYAMPYQLVAEHYANTILLILDSSFLRGRTRPKQQAHAYLHLLLEPAVRTTA